MHSTQSGRGRSQSIIVLAPLVLGLLVAFLLRSSSAYADPTATAQIDRGVQDVLNCLAKKPSGRRDAIATLDEAARRMYKLRNDWVELREEYIGEHSLEKPRSYDAKHFIYHQFLIKLSWLDNRIDSARRALKDPDLTDLEYWTIEPDHYKKCADQVTYALKGGPLLFHGFEDLKEQVRKAKGVPHARPGASREWGEGTSSVHGD